MSFDMKTKEDLQKTFNIFNKRLSDIENETKEIKEIAKKTQSLVEDILYKEGIEKIDAAFETLMNGANNLPLTLRSFDNYIAELQTNANQYLKPERIMEYLESLVKKKEFEKCVAFFTYVIATRAKYLQLLSIYYIYQNDRERVVKVILFSLCYNLINCFLRSTLILTYSAKS